MKRKWYSKRNLGAIGFGLAIIATIALITTSIDAKGGFSSSSRSFSSPSRSYSPSTTKTWSSTRTTSGVLSKPAPTSSPQKYGTKPGTPGSPTSPQKYGTKPGTPGSPTSPQKYGTKPGSPTTSQKYGTKPGTLGPSTKKFTSTSTFDKHSIQKDQKQRSAQSLQAYKADQAKFKQPEAKIDPKVAASNPVVQNIKINRVNYNDYYARRDSYWGSQYRPSPYVYAGPSSFGVWDAMALYGTLSLISSVSQNQQMQSARFAYNHADDPGYQQWRQQAEKQAQSNEDLKKQLAELDKQVVTLKEKGEKKDPSYIPREIPPEVMVSATAVAAKAPEKLTLRVATGQPRGIYEKFGEMLKESARGYGIDVKLIPTAGSLENLKLITSGQADISLIQSDVLAKISHDKMTEQAVFYNEYIQLLANSKGVGSIRKLDPAKDTLYIGPRGSGTALAWEEFCEQEPWYRKIQVKNARYTEALGIVENDSHAYMLFVGGLNSEVLKTAEEFAKKTSKLKLLPVDDKKLHGKLDLHGNPIYAVGTISSKTYPYLQAGWLWSHDVDTLIVKAVLTLSTKWVEENGPEGMNALDSSLAEVQPEILRLIGQK